MTEVLAEAQKLVVLHSIQLEHKLRTVRQRRPHISPHPLRSLHIGGFQHDILQAGHRESYFRERRFECYLFVSDAGDLTRNAVPIS